MAIAMKRTKMSNQFLSRLCPFIFLFAFWATMKRSNAEASPLAKATFDLGKSPTKGDWSRFHQMNEPQKRELWFKHRTNGGKLSDWAWQWRYGWLTSCNGRSRIHWCHEIVIQALNDNAGVIRAKASEIYIGNLKQSAKNSDLTVLVNSFNREDNWRNGKPLFVSHRILKSIMKLPVSEAIPTAKRLAGKHSDLMRTFSNASRVQYPAVSKTLKNDKLKF